MEIKYYHEIVIKNEIVKPVPSLSLMLCGVDYPFG